MNKKITERVEELVLVNRFILFIILGVLCIMSLLGICINAKENSETIQRLERIEKCVCEEKE